MTFSKELIENLKINREELHKIPEVGFREYKTQEYIIGRLKSLGYSPDKICGTGVFLYIDNNKTNTFAFRADIDALAISEENSVDFKSTHTGHMHACGHDGHTSILLGVAEYLSQNSKNFSFNILLIFQPGEENPGGAKDIVETGILEKYNVKGIFGLHILPKLQEGVIGSNPSALMAKAAEINVDFYGKSGHGGQPQTAIDSLQASLNFLTTMNTIVTKSLSPFDPSLISFNKIVGGTVRNIVAEHTRIEGTLRTFSQESFDFICKKIDDTKRGLELLSGVKIVVDIDAGYPPVINNPELYTLLKEGVEKSDALSFTEVPPDMIAEDFSFYQQKVPGLFFFLGSANEELGFTNSLHNSKFNFSSKVLENGLKAFALILDELELKNR